MLHFGALLCSSTADETVRVFICLLSGLFCCLGFSGVMFFAVWVGACFVFAVWAGAQAPPKQQKKKHAPAQTAKKTTRPRPFRACFLFCCLGGWVGGCFFLLFGRGAVWAGGVFFFLLFGRGRVLFLLFGRGRAFFFAVWAWGVFFFCCLGRGREFTHLPVCLARL